MTETNKYVIIVAGGAGTRMESPVPKQFIPLNGTPVVMHTIGKFTHAIKDIKVILVLPEKLIEKWQALCKEYKFSTPVTIAHGGETRFHSVKNGLKLVQENSLVAVHDAVRPMVNEKTIIAGFKDAEMYGNAVPAIPLNDSIRKIESGKSIAVDRSRYCIVQTPQCFRSSLLKKAYEKDYHFGFTDDATVLESCGEKIHLIDGTYENIKITTPKDLHFAALLLKESGLVN